MFGDVLKALDLLVTALTGRRKLRAEDREKFAKIYDEISTVLANFIVTSSDRPKSINLCAELREYVVPIRDLATGRLPSSDVDRLANALSSVCDQWARVHGNSEAGIQVNQHDLDQIAAAEGMFRGVANRIRAI